MPSTLQNFILSKIFKVSWNTISLFHLSLPFFLTKKAALIRKYTLYKKFCKLLELHMHI